MICRVTKIEESVEEAMSTLGKSFYKQAGLPGTFNAEVFIPFWKKCFDAGIAAQWIYLDKGEVVGTLGMLLIMSPFTGETVAEETFWFVDQNHRSTHGIRLFNCAEKWANDLKCHTMRVGYLNNLGAEKLHRFYERRGFTLLQTQFVKQL